MNQCELDWHCNVTSFRVNGKGFSVKDTSDQGYKEGIEHASLV